MPSEPLYLVDLVTADVSENISPPHSGFLTVIVHHNCITVESLLISLPIERYYLRSKNTVCWDVATAVTVGCLLGLCTLWL
jgi:hypothetical protein